MVVEVAQTFGTSSGETGMSSGSARADLIATMREAVVVVLFSRAKETLEARVEGFRCRDRELGQSKEV